MAHILVEWHKLTMDEQDIDHGCCGHMWSFSVSAVAVVAVHTVMKKCSATFGQTVVARTPAGEDG